MTNNFYPFGPSPGDGSQAYLPYDLEIEKIDPGLILNPDEPNGVYTVFREVGGVSWWVINADYNTDDAQWEQLAPCNAANPAFGLAQDSTGNFYRVIAPATVIPGSAVVWTQVASTDPKGFTTVHPSTATSATQIIQNLVDTWNAGTSAMMVARQEQITDTSSAASSLVDNIEVNGTPVWSVRKDGTLVVGMVPYSSLVIPNPWTINVPVTFTDPVHANDGLTVAGGTTTDTLNVTGASTFHGLATFDDGMNVSGGTAVFSDPVSMSDSLAVTGGATIDTLGVTGNEIVGGNLTVDNTTTTANLVVTGSVTVPSGTIPVTSITGSGGIVATYTGTVWNEDGSALVETITSSDSSLNVTRTGQAVNLTVATPATPKVLRAYLRVPISITTPFSQSLSLPTLPGTISQTYQLYASAAWPSSGGTQTLTGSGATWETAQSASTTSGVQPIDLNGTAVGGQTPSVTWTAGSFSGVYTNDITLQIIAYPV
jgi:hypothetical protein